MAWHVQGSLFEELHHPTTTNPRNDSGSTPPPGLAQTLTNALTERCEHTALDDTSFVHYVPHFVPAADSLFDRLLQVVPWEAKKRVMFDQLLDVPRLEKFYDANVPLPVPALAQVRDVLSAHYHHLYAQPFTTTGLCLYRNGADSVAWHGDNLGLSKTADTTVAVVSLGATRAFVLRPSTGGPQHKMMVHHGDLLVMGGACQRTWQHAIPKTTTQVGPRISIQFRPHNVR